MLKLIYDDGIDTALKIRHFPAGELSCEAPEGNPVAVEWHYESDEEIFQLYCLKRHYPSLRSLFVPYLPHARMDRVKKDSDIFTLKYFSELINMMEWDNVIVMDVHSNVSEALIENISNLDVGAYIAEAGMEISRMRGYDEAPFASGKLHLVFPDEGAAKRYIPMMMQEVHYSYGHKMRTWGTNEITKYEIMSSEDLAGKDVLIIDDICSKGGTIYNCAKALKEKGVDKIYVYVTHLENNVWNGKLPDGGLIENIFTTDSIYRDIQGKGNWIRFINTI